MNFALGKFLSENTQISRVNSLATDPELIGPSLLCNVSGTVVGTFNGGGNPVTDLYAWRIYAPSGDLLFSRTPGAFQTINYTFISNGVYKIELDVSRGGIVLEKFSQPVEVVQGPAIKLAQEYISCSSLPVEIQAIEPTSSNFSSYKFEWRNNAGTIVSNSNTLITTEQGNFTVKFFIENSSGEKTCEFQLNTKISSISTILLQSSDTGVCVDGTISFETVPELLGEWFVQKIGDPSKKSLGNGTSITIRPGSDLVDFGDYEVTFLLGNLTNPSCSPQGSATFTYNPEPIFVFEDADTSSGCLQSDGKLIIKALTDLDFINIEGSGLSYGPFVAGELIEIPNLKSGTYNLIGGLGSCINSIGSVVPLANPPTALEFTIDDIIGEACIENGKIPGSFQVTMLNGINPTALFRVINEKGGLALNQDLPDSAVFRVNLPGGRYFFEIYDENDECILPSQTELLIPGKDQTNFQIPETLNICQTFDLVPVTIQSLVFTITRPDLTTDIKNAGEPIFLDQKGAYKIVGTLPGQTDVCPTEKTILVELIDPVDFEAIQISEDCIVGNRSYEANIFSRDPSTVLFFWRNEKNEIISTSQRLDLPPTSFGNYSLEVQPANSEACPIPPKQVIITEPVLKVDVTLQSNQLCELGPGAIVSLETTFPDAVTDIEWRRYSELGEIVPLPDFNNQTEITVFESGTYEASVYSRIPSINKDCELGRSSIELVINPNKIEFSIPDTLSICETYEFTPETTQDLTFEITYPNGETTTRKSNEPLVLTEGGIYIFLGISNDQVPTLCPEVKSMEVTINKKIAFAPELFEETCDGVKIYRANIGTVSTALADFFWFDESGNLIGDEEYITLNTYGNFSLDVQPKGSLPCDQSPISFIVEVPVLNLPVELFAETLCPDAPSTVIRAESQFELVSRIEWWFTNLNGVESQLANQANKREILAFEEGTYEVRIFNEINCLLGNDLVLVMRSMDSARPIVKELYQICPRYEIGETINPGQFAAYEWYHEGFLVSTSPTFKPITFGDFTLVVYSAEGCGYQTTFITEEECELKVSFPNAIEPGNPDKEFLIYTNYLIDELEVFVFSKWGEVIFQCKSTDLISEESTCPWDGTFNGKGIPPGSYAVRINYRNTEKNISKYYVGSILVIE